ncbi:MAG: hypothetical protein KAU31_02150 [Spirochaetaceae bacterium]|nr:hypothetical protein [Spirochaetaceae bacterium]
MNRLSITRVLLTFLLVVPHAQSAYAETASAELMIIAGSDNVALLAQDTRFDPRLQLQSSLQFGVGAHSVSGFELAGGIGIARAIPTSPAVGYSYAGWTGRTAWTRIGYVRPDRSPMGVQLTAYGVLAGYDATYLLSFFPILEFAPTLQVPLTGGAVVSIGLPIGWEIRHDLGLQIGEVFVLPGAIYMGLSTGIRVSVSPDTRQSGK